MPTPKQVRFHYARVYKLRWKLQMALNDAHNADVIVYGKDELTTVCNALQLCWDEFKRTTEKQLAEAIREEITTKL